jgi:hypothetical protein
MWMGTCSMHVGETIALMFALLSRIRAYSLSLRRCRLITVTMSRHRDRYICIARPRVGRARAYPDRLYIIRYALHRSTSSADPIPIPGASYASLRGARLKPFAFCCRACSTQPSTQQYQQCTLRLRRLSRRSPCALISRLGASR